MHDGLANVHTGLAYLLLLLALGNAAVALAGARTGSALAHALRFGHNVGLLTLGRVNLLVGLGLVVAEQAFLTAWWAWASVLLWLPAEVAGLRLVKPEVQAAVDGGVAGSRLVTGTVIQLVVVVALFGLLSFEA